MEIGNKVRLKRNLIVGIKYSGITFLLGMRELSGNDMIIKNIIGDMIYIIGDDFILTKLMVEIPFKFGK